MAATLDDLGLVVEGVELVGEGLADVVVARVESIDPIEGADKIRRIGDRRREWPGRGRLRSLELRGR